MKVFKKIISVLIISLIISVSVVPSFAVDTSDLTYLYIDKGSIVIGDGTVSGYGYSGDKVIIPNSNGYCISTTSSKATSNTVTVTGGENYIVLKNVNISIGSMITSAFVIQNDAVVDLYITGTNYLKSGSSRAGLEVSENATVIISGDGSLSAKSGNEAGIGGGSGCSNGTIIINSGTVTAQCGSEASAIGGGSSGDGGNITINGGNVTAIGGDYGAGIGGGSSCSGGNITINGGTVTATGGTYAAGIGGGWYGPMGSVVINGGSVLAYGGSSAPAIGAGKGVQTSGTPVNSDGNPVFATYINSTALGLFETVTVNGVDFCVCGNHPDDSRFCFYLPEGTNFISVENNYTSAYIYKSEVSASGSVSCGMINPVSGVNGAEIGDDNIIRGITCGLTELDSYLSLQEGFSLAYENEIIGTGTHVTLMYGDIPIFTYRTLLYGDVNKDGFYNGEDSVIVLLLYWGLISVRNTDPLVVEAADADRDGVITESDVKLLEKAGVYLSSVSQNSDGTLDSDSFEEYVLMVNQSPKFSSSADEPAVEEPVSEDNTSESGMNVLDYIFTFIKYAVKILSTVTSFWKNYFINLLH